MKMETVKKISVLGTEYKVEYKTEEEDKLLKKCDGYCDKTSKEIVILKINDENCELHNIDWYSKKVLRHELIHAFMFESGMHECTKWETDSGGHNEQIVDWFAVQSPKILKVFEEVGCI